MKKFYGGIFIEKEKLKEAGIVKPIKLEYYKITNEEEEKYGIEIVKTQYINEEIKVENKEIDYITNNEEKIDEILRILKENEVTPIAVQDVICDFSKEILM
ncbi:MAG: hypothetical protein HUJ68_01070 [Clostridia bacterium]|nr:hypothetical protein [Clostridia bacterium]